MHAKTFFLLMAVIGFAAFFVLTAKEKNAHAGFFWDEELTCERGVSLSLEITKDRLWDSKSFVSKLKKWRLPDPKGSFKIYDTDGSLVYSERISHREDTYLVKGTFFKSKAPVTLKEGYRIEIRLIDVDAKNDDFIGKSVSVFDGSTQIEASNGNFWGNFGCK